MPFFKHLSFTIITVNLLNTLITCIFNDHYFNQTTDIINTHNDKNIPTYSRASYGYGMDLDHDGQDTRTEMLISKSISPVSFKDHKKTKIKSGLWFDGYTGLYFKNADDVDIDHLVPLKEVHMSGGYKWSDKKKRAYANDMGPYSPLRITHRWTNRVPKSAHDPATYSPSYVPERCRYLKDWIKIKKHWGLSMDDIERNAIKKQMTACS